MIEKTRQHQQGHINSVFERWRVGLMTQGYCLEPTVNIKYCTKRRVDRRKLFGVKTQRYKYVLRMHRKRL